MLLVAQEDSGRIIDDDLLGFLVERLPLLLVRDLLRLVEQVIDLGVLIARGILGPYAGTREKRVEEVVRIAVITLPADERGLDLFGTAVIPILGPFLGLDVSLGADLGPVLLDRGRQAVADRVVPAGDGVGHEGEGKRIALVVARLREKLPGLVGIIRVGLQIRVVCPIDWRQ